MQIARNCRESSRSKLSRIYPVCTRPYALTPTLSPREREFTTDDAAASILLDQTAA
jgi:hypothetical protein